MRGLALCAGVAGIELGLKLALGDSYRTVCYVEREAFAAELLARRMEEGHLEMAPIWNDLESFDGRPWRGVVDLLSAGFPCQPVSSAGKRRAQEDERWLWPHVARVVREVRPRIVALENVPGLLVRGFGDVLGELAALGFNAEWMCLRASDLGASHIRRRVFVLAWRERDALRLLTERGEGSARPTEPWDAELGYVGEALANSERTERWALDESGRYLKKRCNGKRETSGRARELREAMGDSHDERRQTREWDLQAGKPDADGASSAVADTDGGRCESERSDGLLDGERAALRYNADRCLSPFPPGPDEDWGGIEESAQPAIRRVAHGLPFRLDRLCSLGNGVVPVVAAKAFLALAERALR